MGWLFMTLLFNNQKKTHLAFKVQTCNDAHVLLKPSNRRTIEIILGGWSNSNSYLRTRVQGPCRDQYNGDVLDCKEFKEFVISWKNGRIMVEHMNSGFRDLMLDLNSRTFCLMWQLGSLPGSEQQEYGRSKTQEQTLQMQQEYGRSKTPEQALQTQQCHPSQ